MEFAEIRQAFENASGLPEEELRAAMAHTDALLPLVEALIGKLKAGVFLLPDQEWLLIYGLHVLAAARTKALWPAWCDLLRMPIAMELLFGDHMAGVTDSITLGLAGDDSDQIFGLIEDPRLHPDAVWGLLEALARLTWEGSVDLARTRAFLTAFERDDRLPEDELAWLGWITAVALLGLVELSPGIERVYAKPVFAEFRPVDRDENSSILAAAQADFADGARFDALGVAPFDDPVVGLSWTRPWTRPESPETVPPEPDDDPAARIRLSEDEELWLRNFLDSAQVPETTMNLEALDGFFTALAVAPEPIPVAEALSEVWGKAAPRGKTFYDSPEQQAFVETLIERYRETLARRIAANYAVDPFLFADDGGDFAADWGSAFMIGVALRPRAWAPLIRHRSAGRLTASITALFNDDPEEPLTLDLRRDIVETLPQIVLGIADFWRSGDRGLAKPVRSEKIGRNDPCPCGSGKKYKKCCGAAA